MGGKCQTHKFCYLLRKTVLLFFPFPRTDCHLSREFSFNILFGGIPLPKIQRGDHMLLFLSSSFTLQWRWFKIYLLSKGVLLFLSFHPLVVYAQGYSVCLANLVGNPTKKKKGSVLLDKLGTLTHATVAKPHFSLRRLADNGQSLSHSVFSPGVSHTPVLAFDPYKASCISQFPNPR